MIPSRVRFFNLFLIAILLFPFAQQKQGSSPEQPATTIINDDITSDTTWTLAGSPYQVQTIVTVYTGITLTIEPGVEVRFADNTRLNVNGTLVADGEPGKGILFTPNNKTPGTWQGIWIYGVSGNRATGNMLDYVTVEYAGGGIAGGANLHLSDADITVRHSQFRNGSENGLYAWNEVNAEVTDTSFTGNANYAAWFADIDTDQSLMRLSASGNGVNGVGVGGSGLPITYVHTWENMGLPYIALGTIVVDHTGSLIIEPGVEVRFADGARLEVHGTLSAMGTAEHPITLTGVTKMPGAWQGIIFSGPYNEFAVGTFRYATIEYAGSGFYNAMIYVYTGRVLIDHSTIRNSAGDGIHITTNGSRSSIEASRIEGNALYGIRNDDPYAPKSVIASNNWWGSNSGPRSDGVCNPGATGDRISKDVVFQPFLTNATADPGPVPTSSVYTLSITPRRWFATAGGLPVYIDIVVYDGKGNTVPGRKVGLTTTRGIVEIGPVTDPQGKVIARLSSDYPGDAKLEATLTDLDGCESARSQQATVTFTATEPADELMEDQAPYLADDIETTPMPVQQGVPTTIRARLTNPNSSPVVVDVSFGVAQAGIGLVFGPAGEVYDVTIPANSTKTVEVVWTPPLSGHYCIEVAYAYHAANSLAPEAKKKKHRSNRDFRPGGLMPPGAKNAIQRAQKVNDALGDADFVNTVVHSPAGVPGSLIQGVMVGNILDFQSEAGGGISCALAGGDNCGGWNGPRMKYPGGSIGNLKKDPPRQDYQVIYVPETLVLPHEQAGPNMPAARAAAINHLIDVSGDLITKELAAVLAYDRMAGASEAEDLTWASVQANAFLDYLHQSALAMYAYREAVDALIAEVNAEGYDDFIITEADYRAYQDRLRTQGWTDTEKQAAALAGITEEGLELIKQRRIAADPATQAGSFMTRLKDFADAVAMVGYEILNPPGFGVIGGSAGKAPASSTPADHQLARVFEVEDTIQIANPLTTTTIINFETRPMNLPQDWIVSLSQDSATLDPGEQVTLTVKIQPGLSVVQGTNPGVAVEGYVGNQLIGGVAVTVPIPRWVEFPMFAKLYLARIKR